MVKKLCDKNKYYLLHCHSPIGSVVARIAAIKARNKYKTKVIYTAHGFHFYKGAPKRNWLIFYPIEKICSFLTDVLITINKEDYEFAQKHMNAKNVYYVPGVGVDTKKFFIDGFDKNTKKSELKLGVDDIIVFSVGELNENKNQEVIVRAIAKLNNPKIHYLIAGQGKKEEELINLAEELGVNLHLLGYRTDIVELLNMSDIFAFSSYREGLSVALMEAMAAGLPCVVSRIRGNSDLIEDGRGGYLCEVNDIDTISEAINKLCDVEKQILLGTYNQSKIKKFDKKNVMEIMEQIYK